MRQNRWNAILFLLKQQRQMGIHELASELNVSTITIRKDLQYLEKMGLILRSHGFASFIGTSYMSGLLPVNRRQKIVPLIKQQLAQKISPLLKNYKTIFIDDSTTTSFLLPYIQELDDITILTNSLNIVYALSSNSHIKVVCTGGILTVIHQAFVGDDTLKFLSSHRVEAAFLGTSGFRKDYGNCENSQAITAVKQLVSQQANETFIMADHTKFYIQGSQNCLSWSNISCIVTDIEPPPNFREMFALHHIKVYS